MASNSTYTDGRGNQVIFWDERDDDTVLRIEVHKGQTVTMPKSLIRQIACEHDYRVVDPTAQMMSNPPRFPTECTKCGSRSSTRWDYDVKSNEGRETTTTCRGCGESVSHSEAH